MSKLVSVLVTGATGFVGSALISVLSKLEYDVRQLVRAEKKQVNSKIKSFYIDSLEGDVDLSTPLNDVDVVIHLAARVHVMNEKHENPLAEYMRVNVESTINLARQSGHMGVKRFIFLSSVKVNGEFSEKDCPFSADDKPDPQDFYGVSKMEAEAALIQISKETGMEVVIIRSPLVYGPDVKANFLTMIKILDKGIPLPFGSIHNKRSLVFIDNLVDLIINVIDHPAARGEIFLVSDDEDISTSRLLNEVGHALGRKARLIKFPETLLNLIFKATGKSGLSDRLLKSLQLDIEKTKKKLGWTPPVTFERAIKTTVNSFLKAGPLK